MADTATIICIRSESCVAPAGADNASGFRAPLTQGQGGGEALRVHTCDPPRILLERLLRSLISAFDGSGLRELRTILVVPVAFSAGVLAQQAWEAANV